MFNTVKRIIALAGSQKKRIYLAFLMNFIESIFASVPVVIILLVLMDIGKDVFSVDRVIIYLYVMLAGLFFQYCFNLAVFRLQSAAGFVIIADERMTIGEQLKRLPMGYFSDTNLGNTASVVTTDLNLLEMYSMQFISKIIRAFSGAVITAVFLFFIDRTMALIALAAYPVTVFTYIRIQRLFSNHAAVRQNSQEGLIAAALEYIQGIAVIKAFNLKGKGFSKFEGAVKNFEQSALDFEMKAVPWLVAYNVSFQIGSALILFFGPYLFFNEGLELVPLLMFIVISFRIYLPIEEIGVLTGIIHLMGACLDRVEKLKETPLLDERDIDSPVNGANIEFKNVTFSYENRKVISDLSFSVEEKSITALVGPSGSGKTTVTSLIARFWDVDSGKITIGGTDIRDMKCDSVLSHMSIVFQNVYLFNDTVLNNISFGRPGATKDDIVKAAEKANCHEFICKMPDGYDTVIGEGGSTLSGGEKQRISIARAILKDAPIVILDEATASLDPENENQIQEAINVLVKDKTLIIIAHRLSTIRNADNIIVLENGRLAEQGRHESLLAMNGIYADFWSRRQKARNWRLGAKENKVITAGAGNPVC